MAKLNFDPADFENIDDGASDILPVGEYIMQIVKSENRLTKAGDGEYLWMELEVLGPRYTGRKFWDRLNLVNKNEVAVKVAKKKLAAIKSALNFASLPTDSEQLHFKPLKVAISHKENKQGNLEPRATYLKADGAAPKAESAPAASAPAPKPWERHKK